MNDDRALDRERKVDRDLKQLQVAFDEADYILKKKYQYELNKFNVIPVSDEMKNMDLTKHVRLFHVESIAFDKEEDNLIKLSNVYNALTTVNGSLVLIIDSCSEKVNFYIGTKTASNKDIHIAYKTLEKSLKGNFPGCKIINQNNKNLCKIVDNLFKFKDENSLEENRVISAVNGISNLREINNLGDKKSFSQGIEKMIDSLRGEIYSFFLIADSIEQNQINEIRRGYENLYTKLSSFASVDISIGYNEGKTVTDSITNGTAESISESLTLSQSHTYTASKATTNSIGVDCDLFNLSRGKTVAKSESNTEGNSETTGISLSTSFSSGISNAITTGESKSVLIRTEDKTVKNLLERIDEQLKRLNICGDLGMWNCAGYFIADDIQTSRTAASTYQALIRGENSGLESISINTWYCDENNIIQNENYFNFIEYLKKVTHPQISVLSNIPSVTPTSLISSSELTLQAGFPQKSVSGLAVSEYASFGREVITRNKENGISFKLGKVHHMGMDELQDVDLDIQSLAAHTFITGSTGSGKSNVIYKILVELGKKGIPFLVIESAKGEYKHIFGNRKDVYVFGSNALKTPILKINPFSFPNDVHVLEHIDRMVEIFNVCWPMYAAMPAVLKDAVERSYIASGWDLLSSTNSYSNSIYPNFNDLLIELHNVINESDFSQELKSNYIGALVTRVKSLTNGINGQIFVSDEIEDSILFDNNTIIDLSRISSSETKALIMGILIMRLQEYRMSECGINKPLKHITVLEEAHNLLKKTSTEQTTESANILGKSVEMLSNSIAEMRTYGEGFIIADQSPNMLDMSVIRNTNTKIILRLPDLSDRMLVGKSASLSENQINEISKFTIGVGAVFQNNWLEPVLCHVDKFESGEDFYVFKKETCNEDLKLKSTLVKCLLSHFVGEKVEYYLEDLSERVFKSNLSTCTKLSVIQALKKDKTFDISELSSPIAMIFDSKNIFENAKNSKTINEWNEKIIFELGIKQLNLDTKYSSLILQCLIREYRKIDTAFNEIYEKWTVAMRGDLI